MKYILFIIFLAELSFAEWEPDARLTDTLYSVTNYNHAKCIASAGCTLHITWFDYRDGNAEIYYKRSTNNGTTWGQDMRLTHDIYSSVYPAIAASNSAIHIVWRGFGNILYKRSTDGGNTWSADTSLTDNVYSYDPSIAASGRHIYVCWWGSIPQDTIYFTKSDDDGLTWRRDTALINLRASATGSYITSNDSIVFILWYDHDLGGYYEIFHKYSNDFGSTWSRDTQLTYPPNTSADPCASISGNDIHVAWTGGIAKGTNVNFEIFYKHSTDRGSTWSADTNLSYSLGWCRFQSISASGSNVHLVWIDDYGGYWDLYYKKSSNRGFTWDSTVRLTNEPAVSTYPHITTADSGVHVIWTDDRSQKRQIYYKRNLLGNIGIKEQRQTDSVGQSIKLTTSNNPMKSGNLCIWFSLQKAAKTKLAVYNSIGQCEGILVDCLLTAGTHKMKIRKRLSTAVYFLHLQIEDKIITKKLVAIE